MILRRAADLNGKELLDLFKPTFNNGNSLICFVQFLESGS